MPSIVPGAMTCGKRALAQGNRRVAVEHDARPCDTMQTVNLFSSFVNESQAWYTWLSFAFGITIGRAVLSLTIESVSRLGTESASRSLKMFPRRALLSAGESGKDLLVPSGHQIGAGADQAKTAGDHHVAVGHGKVGRVT